RAAVVVARKDRSAKHRERIPKTVIAEMGEIENHAHLLHCAQKVVPHRSEPAGVAGAVSVGAGSVMRGADGAKSVCPPPRDMSRRQDRVRAFHRDEKPERSGLW